MMDYYLAIDIGASSGRHILAWLADGQVVLEEVYRFKNEITTIDNQLCWGIDRIVDEVVAGMKRCAELGKIPKTMAIDTWAVDFALLSRGKRVGNVVSYRDHRTDGVDSAVYAHIPSAELYARTGIQKQPFNTIYQLMALKLASPELLDTADTLLMVPDYLNFRLTGKIATEYTNATTTQLVNVHTGGWDTELIDMLGYPKGIFTEIVEPGTRLGALLPDIASLVGYSCDVVATASHDTASAVVSVPSTTDDAIYISSGTWSLIGIERLKPDCTERSMLANFTNEGGYQRRYRYLKNIMGLWMIQSIQRELPQQYSFAELCELAKESDFTCALDVNDRSFLSPTSMIEAIESYCQRTEHKSPRSAGDLAKVVYVNLAASYAEAVKELEELTGTSYAAIHVVGGGANADYLNQLTAKATGKPVYAGPTEATAIGNISVQMLADGKFASLGVARRAIRRSFDVQEY